MIVLGTVVVVVVLLSTGSAIVTEKGECQHDFECDMELSICVNSTCVCPPGYVRNSDMTKCLQGAIGFGAKCVDSLQCSYSLKSGGYCTNGTCSCTNRYHYLRGRCWRTSGLNETCHTDENCFVNYDFESAICNPTSKRCECAQGYYQREYSSCRKISGAGGPCAIPLDCKNCEDAVCTRNRTCQCSSSTDPTEAAKRLEVRTSRPPHRLTVRSVGSPAIGDNCTKPEDCSGMRNVDCLYGKCLCKIGYYNTDSKTDCYPEIGSVCSSDGDCVGKNTMCETDKNLCVCKTGFVVAEGNRMCEKLSRNISWSCLKLEECSILGGGGICVRKKCACSSETHFIPEELFCWRTKKVGEPCADNRDCGSNSSVESCSNGVCACAEGYHRSGQGFECRIDSKKVGDDCGEDADCMFPHAACSNVTNKCVCLPHYVHKQGACYGGIGSSCSADGDCKEVKESACRGGTCRCSSDEFVPSRDDSLCLPVATEFQGPCQEVQQCTKLLGVEGRCTGHECVCSEGHHYVVGQGCLEDVQLEGRCWSSGQCLGNYTYCFKGTCACRLPYRPGHNQTACVSGSSNVSSHFVSLLLVAILFEIIF